jgi:hypothetical protein
MSITVHECPQKGIEKALKTKENSMFSMLF